MTRGIRPHLVRTFDVARERAEQDALEFLDRLADAGLIRPLGEPVR